MKIYLCIFAYFALFAFSFAGCTRAADPPEGSTNNLPVVELEGHENSVKSAAFSPDGKKVVTASDDCTVRIWDAETGEELQKLDGNSAIFFPDGKKVVTISGHTAKIWDAETGEELQKLDGHSAIFSPDGKKVVTISDYATIWDAKTGKELRKLKGQGHTGSVNSAVFSSDGKKVVTISHANYANRAQIWDADTGEELKTPEGDSAIFSPDGKKVITISNHAAKIWNADTWEELQKLDGHSAIFSPDGKKVVMLGNYTTSIWNVNTRKELQELKGAKANSAIFSPDGKKVITIRDHTTITIWDTDTGKELRKLEGLSVIFSPDGKKVATISGDTVKILNVNTWEELQDLKGHTHYVNSAAFSPDGKKVVTGGYDKIARIWDLPTIEKQVADAKEAEAKRIAEHKAVLAKTESVDLKEELQKSGFSELSDFIQYGNAKLKGDLQKADAFDKPDIEAKIRVAKADSAKKTFYGEYNYTTTEVKVGDANSSFTMIIPTGFIAPKVGEVLLPMSGLTGKVGKLDRCLTAPIVKDGYGREWYSFLLEEDKILPFVTHSRRDATELAAYLPNGHTPIGNNSLKNVIKDTSGMVLYARYDDPSRIVLSVSGTTDGIRELVRNSDNYQVRVWFNNLQYCNESKGIEYWLTNAFWRKNADVNDPRYDNPFVTTEQELVETISADVVKIEIIKK